MRNPLLASKRLVASLVLGTAVVVVGYLFFFDEYTVETTFSHPVRSAQAQVPLLNSPELRLLVAEDFFAGKLGTWPVDKSMKVVPASASPTSDEALLNKVKQYSGPTNFAEWLSKEMSVSCNPSQGKCTISLSGSDPNFLKSVLSAFARHHQDLDAANLGLPGQPGEGQPSVADESENTRSVGAVEDRLAEIAYEQRACELALSLMKSDKSVFCGFLPADSMVGTSSLSAIQSKIAQLEMRKRTLSVYYPPGSREIQSVNDEIAGLRKDMEASVEQHLLFLKEKEQVLLVKEKRGNEAKVSAGKRRLFTFTEPIVSRTPLRVRLAEQVSKALTF